MTDERTNERTTERTGPRSGRRSTRNKRRRSIKLPSWLERWPAPARTAFIVLVCLVAVISLATGADALASAGRIHPGVLVGDLAVGGKTVDEASVEIASYVAERSAVPVSVQADDMTWDVTAESVSLSVDATTLAGDAYLVGRGRPSEVIGGRLRALFGGVTVPLALSCDQVALEALVTGINEAVGTPAVDAGVRVEGSTVTRIEPVDGVGVDVGQVRSGVVPAFLSDDRSVPLQLGPVEPIVDADGAEQAYQEALTMVSAPLTLYYADRQWEVPPAIIGDWIGFRRVEGAEKPTLEAYVVPEDLKVTLDPMVAEVGKPARDASFEVSSGAVTIVPSEDGLRADAEDLAVRLTTVLTGAAERRAELTMQRVEPEITTAEAQGMGIVERLSTFSTDFDSSNKPRVNNIHILADALDGTLVPPGGMFSFNETIGPRTAEKGYQEANAIVNGKLVPQLGGGICQIGTTIFNTVFFSGLPVVERHNHSQYISHYPTGRDATISWGGPDFKFKNDTPNWVLVATGYSNSSITISLYGTKPGYEVTYDTGPWTGVIAPPVREVPDPTLPLGSRVVEERGISGRTIVVVRHVKKDGVEFRTDTFKSVYRATEEVVRVGTGEAVPSAPATTTP
ncbi:MAG: VanW family protein [Coriobacteriia bacterium]|nr:VanW family protein [Coriobacteriia bacterium]